MYNNYTNYLSDNIDNVIFNFKSNMAYKGILEHVSFEYGEKYLQLILSEFSFIDKEKIKNYCELNDKYGTPNKQYFIKEDFIIACSPTSLRYVYHSLLILKYLNKTDCNNIVEVGCGYGGLCLAINYFMTDFEVNIEIYNIIDLSEPLILIEKYLSLHKEIIKTEIVFHDSSTYGKNIENNKLFFISNYCYTEISEEYNRNYTTILIPKVLNGFITWQNGGNNGLYPVKNAKEIIKKEIKNVEEERPQTDSGHDIHKNYFVYF